jgi:hypothetical protein
MTPEEFTAFLDTYGADLTRWPHAQRQGAQRLLQASEQARNAFADAQMLDSVLREPEPRLSPARCKHLTDSILDNLPDEPITRNVAREPYLRRKHHERDIGATILRPLTPLWIACLSFGMIVGVILTLGHSPAPETHAAERGWVETWAIYGGV